MAGLAGSLSPGNLAIRVPEPPPRDSTMQLNLNHIGQIALAVGDVDRAETFFGEKLGLRKLYRFGDLSFFDCAGVRLMLEKAHNADEIQRSSVIPTFIEGDSVCPGFPCPWVCDSMPGERE
jgi:hypothetical protein